MGGKRLNGEELKTRRDVEQAMHFWADTAAYRLCTLAGREQVRSAPDVEQRGTGTATAGYGVLQDVLDRVAVMACAFDPGG